MSGNINDRSFIINGMGRPRTASTLDILAAAARVVTRSGPAGVTFAEVGREAGLAPATLVQRFGSKRGLLLALAEQGAAGVAEPFDEARATHASPLRALTEALVAMAASVPTPEALANHLAFFQIDLREPDFHALALAHATGLRAQVQTLLDDAVAAGELEPCDTGRLARAVQVTYNGSLVTWAVHREGGVEDWLREDLDRLLSPARSRSR